MNQNFQSLKKKYSFPPKTEFFLFFVKKIAEKNRIYLKDSYLLKVKNDLNFLIKQKMCENQIKNLAGKISLKKIFKNLYLLNH